MSAAYSRPIVYQSFISEKDSLNRVKTTHRKELISNLKVSLNKTLLINEKSLEPKFESSENPNFSLKQDSVKRISQLFERDTSASPKQDSKVDKLYRKPNDGSLPSELQDKIKSFETKIKSRDDAKNHLIKRKSENIDIRPAPETIRNDTELNLALLKTKRLPSMEIDEIVNQRNNDESNQIISSKVKVEKIDIKNIWGNKEKTRDLKKETQTGKQNSSVILNETVSTFDQENKDTNKPEKESILPDKKSNSVKLIITRYQTAIESNLEKDKPRKNKFKFQEAESKEDSTKVDSKSSVKGIVKEMKPTEIELIQEDKNVNVVNNVNSYISAKNEEYSIRSTLVLPSTIAMEITNKGIADSDTEPEPKFISNEMVEVTTPSSSIRDIIKMAKLTAESEFTTNKQLKEPEINVGKPKTYSYKPKEASNNSEKLSFKEELERKLLKKSAQHPSSDEIETLAGSKERNNTVTNSRAYAQKNFETKNKIESKVVNGHDESENKLVFSYKIGKKSKEEEMTNWVSVEEVIIKTKEELEQENLQNEKKNISNKKFPSPYAEKTSYNGWRSKREEVSKDYNDNHSEDHNNDIDKKEKSSQDFKRDNDEDTNDKPSENNDNSQLERFISKHLEKQMKQNKMSSKGKNSSKHGATRMRSHNRPNASEYFKESDSKVLPNGPIASSVSNNEVPAPDYD